MNCQYCNSPVPPGAAQCPACGAQVPVQQGYNNQSPQYGQPYGQPQYGQPYGLQQPVAGQKSRATYIILGLLLGGFGVHNFYAGYTGKAVAQLLITLTTVWFGGGLVVGIWILIEVFTVKVDANGNPFA